MASEAPRHTNRLIHATSPYLLQHAHNPVDWHPWDQEALGKAQAEDRPILLSIGYSACHWCHVMERESFENEAIAALLNAHFVPIKVDREERPDLDDIYMAATLAMNHGQGGWPMTVFLTPDQQPFYAGTYYPPEDAHGRPGFRTLLLRIAELWRTEREGLRSQAAALTRYLRDNTRPLPGASLGEVEITTALEELVRDFDPRWGGFGQAPKFPPSTTLSLLLRCHRRSGDAHALEMVVKTLDMMAGGGMYDQVGGGFFRYSTDAHWLVPHFEKMLYDNALLAKVYLEGWQAAGHSSYARIAREVFDYVLREMTSPEDGFCSATDADSEGEEGRFFVWTPAQVREALGDAELARRFCAFYDVTEEGNWEGQSIPHSPDSVETVAARLHLAPEQLQHSLDEAHPRMYQARRRRVAPALDDKVLTSWNGLMIGALAEGFRILGERRYLEAAQRAADFLLRSLRTSDGRLLRTYRGGQAHIPAFLEDYAFLAEGLLDLYEAGGPERCLGEAEALASRIRSDFAAAEGGFYSTAADHETLILRHREGHDGATPGANATAAQVLVRLSHHLDRADLRDQAVGALRAWGKAIARQPRAFAKSLLAVDLLLEGPIELAFVGPEGRPDFEALRREAGRHFLPNRVIAHHDPQAGASPHPLLAGKGLVDGQAALYVCRNYACQKPITAPAEVQAALADGPAPPSPDTTILSSRLRGHATPEGTAGYAAGGSDRGLAPGYTLLGSSGLMVSRVGFGGYRVDDETPEHREALGKALLSGCNLIDTSTNYTDGASERLVGEVLHDLVANGRLRREQVVVVSKIGYLQGENYALAQRRAAAGRPFPEVVEYGEGLWHCIHPDFVADQLDRSLGRLGLETLDLCLLHNPEYFLADAVHLGHADPDGLGMEFDRRLTEAFRYLETQVTAGRLLGYGVSSNTCVKPSADPEATSLARMLAAAEGAGGPGHHFRALQLPLNLFEAGAALEENSGPEGRQTVFDYARGRRIGVLANRPLNAFPEPGLVRLADVEVPESLAVFEEVLERLGALETEYRTTIASELQAAEKGLPPAEFFRWEESLRDIRGRARGLEHWRDIESQGILPRLNQALRTLDRNLAGAPGQRWRAWRARYVPGVQRALGELAREAAERSWETGRAVAAALAPLLPAQQQAESLSRQALWTVAHTPGVSAVLCGMRKPAYVEDALGILAWQPFPRALAAYAAVAKLALPR